MEHRDIILGIHPPLPPMLIPIELFCIQHVVVAKAGNEKPIVFALELAWSNKRGGKHPGQLGIAVAKSGFASNPEVTG
jgi:hypothetical protein